jgi:recombination protein RecA
VTSDNKPKIVRPATVEDPSRPMGEVSRPALAAAMTKFNKARNSEALTMAGKAHEIPRIVTGIPALDIAMGGGYPAGRMTLLWGEFSSAKTSTAMKFAAAFQRTCRNCGKPMWVWNDQRMTGTPRRCCDKPVPCANALVDLEGALDKRFAARLGVNVDDLILIQPASAEEGIDAVTMLIESGEVDHIIFDSIAAATPTYELEHSAGEMKVGAQALLINQAMRVWMAGMNVARRARPLGCSLTVINQIRMKAGKEAMFGDPRVLPGGKGQGFAASLVVESKRRAIHKDDMGVTRWIDFEVSIPKNKTGIPFRSAEWTLYITPNNDVGAAAGGSDVARQVLRLAEAWGLVTKSGSWYILPDGSKYQGLDNVCLGLVSTPEGRMLLQTLQADVEQHEMGLR